MNINNGDPVSGAGSNIFNEKIESLVKKLIDKVVIDESKVTVKYDVSMDTYNYVKLVYKEKDEPLSVDDGESIDLDLDYDEVYISGLTGNTMYCFKIFTDEISSEPYYFDTAVQEGIIKIRVSVSRPVVDSDILESVSYSKLT